MGDGVVLTGYGAFGKIIRIAVNKPPTWHRFSSLRCGTFYSDLSPLEVFDIVVHLPHVTPAEPNHAAGAQASRDVQEAFSQWKPE